MTLNNDNIQVQTVVSSTNGEIVIKTIGKLFKVYFGVVGLPEMSLNNLVLLRDSCDAMIKETAKIDLSKDGL